MNYNVFANIYATTLHNGRWIEIRFPNYNNFSSPKISCNIFGRVLGYKMIFRAGDLGEPNTADTARAQLFDNTGQEVYDTHDGNFFDESSCVGTARTGLDNGKLKIEFEF